MGTTDEIPLIAEELEDLTKWISPYIKINGHTVKTEAYMTNYKKHNNKKIPVDYLSLVYQSLPEKTVRVINIHIKNKYLHRTIPDDL